MVIFNYSEKQISAKIVYYGPGLGGKTTTLSYIHSVLDDKDKGEMLSLATDADRTLYFDFLHVKLGKIRGLQIKFQLYTVPGQIRYNNTRKIVLSGADAIVFVADSQVERFDANIESYKNMKINLLANQINPETIPLVIQYNKRDLESIVKVPKLNRAINDRGVPHFETIATQGKGVLETFQTIGTLLLQNIAKKYKVKIQNLSNDFLDLPENKVAAKAPVQKEAIQEEPLPEAIDLTEDNIDVSSDYYASQKDEGDISAFPSAYHKDPDYYQEEYQQLEIHPPREQDGATGALAQELLQRSAEMLKMQAKMLELLKELLAKNGA